MTGQVAFGFLAAWVSAASTNIRAQHHSGAATSRRIIDIAMLAFAELAKVDGLSCQSLLAGLAGQRSP